MTSSALLKARESMVVSQLQPAGITTERVIEAYRTVAREDFLPENLKHVCYLDESIDLGHGGTLLEPLLHGLMVNELDIQGSEFVLDLGDPTGYSKAILTQLGANVSTELSSSHNFDAILINGAVAFIPDPLIAQLKVDGRLACILQPEAGEVGKIVILTKEQGGTLSKQVFEDAKARYVAGFEPVQGFVF